MATKLLGLTRGSLVKRVSRLDFQFALFDKLALPSTCAERSQFVLNDSAIAVIDRGEQLELDNLRNYKLVPRERPIRITEDGNGNYGGSVFSYGGNIAGLHAMSNDETKLFLSGQMVGSVECGETASFANL